VNCHANRCTGGGSERDPDADVHRPHVTARCERREGAAINTRYTICHPQHAEIEAVPVACVTFRKIGSRRFRTRIDLLVNGTRGTRALKRRHAGKIGLVGIISDMVDRWTVIATDEVPHEEVLAAGSRRFLLI
jgi:hypothetical protein